MILTVISKLKDFPKSHALKYTAKVYYYQKRRKIETLLLRTTNSTHHGLRGSARRVLTATGLASGRWKPLSESSKIKNTIRS